MSLQEQRRRISGKDVFTFLQLYDDTVKRSEKTCIAAIYRYVSLEELVIISLYQGSLRPYPRIQEHGLDVFIAPNVKGAVRIVFGW
jgi:hypothetical protein